jgi:integrase
MAERRPPGRGSITKVADGVYRLQWSEGRDAATGVRRRPTRVFHGTEAEATLELDRLIALSGRGSTSAVTLWEFIDRMYLPAIEPPELRRRTVDEYRRKLEKYVKHSALASVRMDKLTRYAFVSWMRGVKDQVANKQTQLHIYRALSAALTKAEEWGLLEENLLRKAVRPPTPDEHTPIVLDVQAFNDYLDAFSGHELEPVVVLQLSVALRPSEALGMEWGDIDLDRGVAYVRRGLHQRKGEVFAEPTKSKASTRALALPSWARAALKPHRGIGRVIGALTPEQVRWRYKKHVTDSKLTWCPMENLRHTSLTLAVSAGAQLNSLVPNAGHTSAKMLEERYVKQVLALSQMVADTMDSLRVAK